MKEMERNGISGNNHNGKFIYDAFISYRHTEPDMFAAQTLHKEMESFKLPSNIRKKMEVTGKTRINRVFRDRDELPIANNLADPITEALAVSEFLIVICSSRLPESQWCRKEIQTFISMHGREKILAVLVEGEPQDSFPEELLFKEEEEILSDGSVIINKIPIEPLAADIRGSNDKRIKKKIKEEIIRLAAPMFGCAYDELKQRHRERRVKRMLAAAAAVSIIGLTFGTVSTAMAVKISGQNKEIQKQSAEIQDKSQVIREQYWEVLTNIAVMKAAEANNLYEQGDRQEAVRIAGSVMPETMGEGANIPYTAHAEYVLSKSMGIYENGRTIMPAYMVKHDTNVSFMQVSEDRKILLTVDDANVIYIWEFKESDEPVLKTKIENYTDSFITEHNIVLLKDNRIACLNGDMLDFLDLDGKHLASVSINYAYAITSDSNSQYLAAVGDSEVLLLDAQSGNPTYEFKAQEGRQIVPVTAFNEEGNRFAFAEQDGNGAWVSTVDLSDGSITAVYTADFPNVDKMQFEGNSFYVLNNTDFSKKVGADGTESVLSYDVNGQLLAYDVTTGELKWKHLFPNEKITELKQSGNAQNNIIMTTSYSKITAINGDTGEVIDSNDLGEEIVKIGRIMDSNYFVIYTRGGRLLTALAENNILQVLESIGQFQSNSDNVKSIWFGIDNKIILLPYQSKDITVLQGVKGKNYEALLEAESSISKVSADEVSHDILVVQNYAADRDSAVIELYGADGNKKWSAESADSMAQAAFTGEKIKNVAIVEKETVTLVNKDTGEKEHSYQLTDLTDNISFGGEYNQYLFTNSGNVIKVIETESGNLKEEFTCPENIGYGDLKTIDSAGNYAAVLNCAEKKLEIYELASGEVKGSVSINTAFASNVLWANAHEIHVVYKNMEVERYQISQSFELVKDMVYKEFEEQIDRIEVASNQSEYSLMVGTAYSYLLREGEVIACIPLCKTADFESGRFYVGSASGHLLQTVPIYTYEMLLSEYKQF